MKQKCAFYNSSFFIAKKLLQRRKDQNNEKECIFQKFRGPHCSASFTFCAVSQRTLPKTDAHCYRSVAACIGNLFSYPHSKDEIQIANASCTFISGPAATITHEARSRTGLQRNRAGIPFRRYFASYAPENTGTKRN